MERESFEDEEVAALMNQYFVPIKVDREERPDVDHLYMTAVQLMTQSGGWPLNCFTLPDGRPIYGGTYFPKETWTDILNQLATVYQDEPGKVEEYAGRLEQGIKQVDIIDPVQKAPEFDASLPEKMVGKWSNYFDREHGGPKKAPKFPLPNNYEFLLQYSRIMDDRDTRDHVELTLDKMADGGIYDQIGGGFARYSTDEKWKVPHFEKMLYDNGQLVSLYAKAWKSFGKDRYEQVVDETIEFVKREMASPEMGFYSAIDADSEGEEGKFHVWTKEEIQEELEDDYPVAREAFHINEKGKWENDKFIILRDHELEEKMAKEREQDIEDFRKELDRMRKVLFDKRESRTRPETDDKIITSWNALMNIGLTDSYKAFGKEDHKETAKKNMSFLLENQKREGGGLYRIHKDGSSSIPGYLDDLVFMIQALGGLYEVTFDEKWLQEGKSLLEFAIQKHYDPDTGMFYYSSDEHPQLVSRTTEVMDNVIPASCSAMARVLFYYGHWFDEGEWLGMADRMLNNVQDGMERNASAFSNWGMLFLHRTYAFFEVAITGPEAMDRRQRLQARPLPNAIYLGGTKEGALPLLEGKFKEGETWIYVCYDKTCKEPVQEVKEAVKQMKGDG